jgi:hypothetical protein
MRSELTEFLLLDFFSRFLDCFFFFTNGYHVMPISVEYINSIKFRLIACSDLFHDFASFRGVSISYLPSDLNYFENKKVNFVFSISYLCPSFYYTVGGKVSLAGLSLDPPVILKVNFNISYAYFRPI